MPEYFRVQYIERRDVFFDQGTKLLHDSKIFQNKFLKDLKSQP